MRNLIFLILTILIIGGFNPPWIDRPVAAQEKTNPLSRRQKQFLQTVENLERKLLSLSSFEMDRNRNRAELLKKGLQFSQARQIIAKLKETSRLLDNGKSIDLKKAVETQTQILEDLEQLYELLQSENPQKQIRDRKELLRKRIDQIKQMIRQQQGLREQIEFADDFGSLQEKQLRLKSRTLGLKSEVDQEIKNQKNETATPSTGGNEEPPEMSSPPDQPDTTTDTKTPSSTESRISNQLESATQKMQDAAQKLNSLKSGAVNEKEKTNDGVKQDMENAEAELAKAKLELDEILRQEREKEIDMTLRSLEERFKAMLALQLKINEQTSKLESSDKPVSQKNIGAFEIASRQKENILEADRTLLILNEEGTSRAIPGTLSQAKADMRLISNRLEEGRLDSATLELQSEVAAVLNDLVASVQKEQKEQAEDRKSKTPPPDFDASLAQKPLIQKIAELKIIRQLQFRINERHKRFAKQVRSGVGKFEKAEISLWTRQLGQRQKQLELITRDLVKESEK